MKSIIQDSSLCKYKDYIKFKSNNSNFKEEIWDNISKSNVHLKNYKKAVVDLTNKTMIQKIY